MIEELKDKLKNSVIDLHITNEEANELINIIEGKEVLELAPYTTRLINPSSKTIENSIKKLRKKYNDIYSQQTKIQRNIGNLLTSMENADLAFYNAYKLPRKNRKDLLIDRLHFTINDAIRTLKEILNA